jgi:hypothetical protein
MIRTQLSITNKKAIADFMNITHASSNKYRFYSTDQQASSANSFNLIGNITM